MQVHIHPLVVIFPFLQCLGEQKPQCTPLAFFERQQSSGVVLLFEAEALGIPYKEQRLCRVGLTLAFGSSGLAL
jgi:hypothetical protein